MMVSIPGMSFGFSPSDSRLSNLAINGQALGWIVAGAEREPDLFLQGELAKMPLFMTYSGDGFKPSVPIVPRAIRRGVRGGGVAGSVPRYLIWHLAGQFLRLRRRAGLMHRRRNFRVRIAGRILTRRFGGLARRRRRDLGRFDRHRCSPSGDNDGHAARFR
jgi:hypothetical protein